MWRGGVEEKQKLIEGGETIIFTCSLIQKETKELIHLYKNFG